MPGAGGHLVEATGLSKRYVDGPTEVQVLDGLDLVIDAGERVAIVGESGVGKSTLLHILGTLDMPTGGRPLLDGVDVFDLGQGRPAAVPNPHLGFGVPVPPLPPGLPGLENRQPPAPVGRRARAPAP